MLRFFNPKSLDTRIQEKLLSLKNSMDDLTKTYGVKFNENYAPKTNDPLTSFRLAENNLSDRVKMLSDKYQFLLEIKNTRSKQEEITSEILTNLEKKFPKALEGKFSEVKSIVNEMKKESNTTELKTKKTFEEAHEHAEISSEESEASAEEPETFEKESEASEEESKITMRMSR